LCALADVPRIHLHDVRHSHATDLLNHGWTVVDVAARLGHRDSNVTLQTYLHALPDRYGAMVQDVEARYGVMQ
jgi:integrase